MVDYKKLYLADVESLHGKQGVDFYMKIIELWRRAYCIKKQEIVPLTAIYMILYKGYAQLCVDSNENFWIACEHLDELLLMERWN